MFPNFAISWLKFYSINIFINYEVKLEVVSSFLSDESAVIVGFKNFDSVDSIDKH